MVARICVDHQLEEFEASLRAHIECALGRSVNTDYWFELDAMNREVRDSVFAAVDLAIKCIYEQYILVTPVTDILGNLAILIPHVVWAAVNVPFPHDPTIHLAQVIENALQVYVDVIYAGLRTEMIMANHNASVLQRTWRRVVSDPNCTVCQHRLEREFSDLESIGTSHKVSDVLIDNGL
jgi:hypothetical protein